MKPYTIAKPSTAVSPVSLAAGLLARAERAEAEKAEVERRLALAHEDRRSLAWEVERLREEASGDATGYALGHVRDRVEKMERENAELRRALHEARSNADRERETRAARDATIADLEIENAQAVRECKVAEEAYTALSVEHAGCDAWKAKAQRADALAAGVEHERDDWRSRCVAAEVRQGQAEQRAFSAADLAAECSEAADRWRAKYEKASEERDAAEQAATAAEAITARLSASLDESRRLAFAGDDVLRRAEAALLGHYTGDLAADVAKLRREYEGDDPPSDAAWARAHREVCGPMQEAYDAEIAAYDEDIARLTGALATIERETGCYASWVSAVRALGPDEATRAIPERLVKRPDDMRAAEERGAEWMRKAAASLLAEAAVKWAGWDRVRRETLEGAATAVANLAASGVCAAAREQER